MLHKLLSILDNKVGIEVAQAHCDIPCKIYDPAIAQIAALSVIRFLDLINELADKSQLSLAEQAQLSRLVREKEIHAAKVKDEITVIWGDYFKAPQIEKFPNIHQLVHGIMLAGSACKQHVSRDKGERLLELVNEFADAFWQTKGVDTYTATSPYLPNEPVVYPKLV